MLMWLKSWIHLPELIALGVVEQKKTNALLTTLAAASSDQDSRIKALNDHMGMR